MTHQRDRYESDRFAPSESVLERHRSAAADVLTREGYGHLVGGEWREGEGGETGEAVDASTGETLATFRLGTAADVDAAVTAAGEAADGTWGQTGPLRRADLLDAVADRLEARKHEIAKLDSLEVGKPNKHTLFADATILVTQLRHFASLARTADSGRLPAHGDGKHLYTRREPYGVVGAISAWNFPAMFVAWKLGPALAAGNAVVFKPSERAVLSSLEVAREFDRVLPPGTVNVVTGTGPEVGQALASHPDVGALSLTGSRASGAAVMRTAADTVTPVSLELGGNNPNVVFPDADVAQAVEGALVAIFFNGGQQCTAGSRLFCHEAVLEEFLGTLRQRLGEVVVGDPLSPLTDVGPVVDHDHQSRVREYVDDAVASGATVVAAVDGPGDDLAGAPFVTPTVLTDVDDEADVVAEEVFGPVLTVHPWRDRDDVLRRANDTEYGLAAGVWTSDLRTAHEAAADLAAGTVWVNTYNDLFEPAPYGGFGASGFGKELAAEALDAYRREKTVRMNFEDVPELR